MQDVERITQIVLATEECSLSSGKKMPLVVSDHPTRVSAALLKATESTPVECCGKWLALPPATSIKPGCFLLVFPMMPRTASLSWKDKTEGNGWTSSHYINKGQNMFMRT